MTSGLKGFDASHYQGAIDFPKVKADGYSFVYLKATQGAAYNDPTFKKNYKAARSAGLLVGAYHFADTSKDAKAEAAHFAKALKGRTFDLKPALDLEQDKTGGHIVEWMQAFLNELARLGYSGALYSFGVFFLNNLQKSYGGPLWYARYASTPIGVSDYAAWQYSSKGRIEGISGYVDLNVAGPTWGKLLMSEAKAPKVKAPPKASNAPIKVRAFMYVAASLLNIRTGPSTKYKSIGQLKFGDRVQYVTTVGDFAAIKSGANLVYVGEKYLTAKAPTKKKAKAPYVVRSGDSLWTIAEAKRTTIAKLKSKNGLKGDTIYPGQKLKY
jgi:lysozyme